MTVYPAQIDNIITLPQAIDNVTPITGDIFNQLRTTIIGIEQALGVNPAGIYGTVANRLTTLENIVISGGGISTPVGPAGGDLGNAYPNPSVFGLRGIPISSTAPSDGNILTYVLADNKWEPKSAPSGFTAGGDLSGTSTNQTVIAIDGHSVSINSIQRGDLLVFNGTSLVNRSGEGLNVRDFGAVGDGATDDTAAIQAAIDAASTAGDYPAGKARKVFFPTTLTGQAYRVYKPLFVQAANIVLEGENSQGSIIATQGLASVLLAVTPTGEAGTDCQVGPPLLGSTGNSMYYVPFDSSGQGQFFDLRDGQAFDLNGITGFSFEATIKYTVQPTQSAIIYSHSGSEPTTQNVTATLNLYINAGTDSSHATLYGSITTSSGYVLATLTNAIQLNVATCIQMSWDGNNLHLFAGTPGSTTISSSVSATGTLVQHYWEGAWIGAGNSETWPIYQPSNPQFTGYMDSLRISNFARNTSNYTTQTIKFDTGPTSNNNVGGNPNHYTLFLCNFDTYCSAWHGYTYYLGYLNDWYILNRPTKGGIIGGTTGFQCRNLQLQCPYGRALQIQGTQDSILDSLVIIGRYGVTYETDSYYNAMSNIVLSDGLNPSSSGYPGTISLIQAMGGSISVKVYNATLTTGAMYPICVPGGSIFAKGVNLALNSSTYIPILNTHGFNGGLSSFQDILFDSENVNTATSNWICGIGLASIGKVSFKDCSFDCSATNNIPILKAALSQPSSGEPGTVTFDNCFFNQRASQTTPVFEILTGWEPSTPIWVNRCLSITPGHPFTSTAQQAYAPQLGNILVYNGTDWTNRNNDYINVLDFGAKGDGVTDDTAAIQAAINYAYTNKTGQSVVYFPTTGAAQAQALTGATTIYRTSSPIFNPYSGVKLKGQNAFGTGAVNIGLSQSQGDSNTFPILQVGQTNYDPIYTVRGNITTATCSPGSLGLNATYGQINFGQCLGNDIHGLGVSTTTTANFTQPTIGSSVTVSVVNSAVFSTNYPANAKIYIIGGGIYNVASIIDSTHVSLTNTGFPECASAGTVINSGTVVGVSGFTFEMFYDPVTSNQGQVLASSSGSRGTIPITKAFFLSTNIYNTGNYVNIYLTTTNGIYNVTSSNSLNVGSLNHVAFTYDGIHLSVFVNGTKTSITASGTIVQNNYETIMIGQDSTGWGISLQVAAFGYGTGFQYGSVRMCQQAVYNANFTTPTTELSLINRITNILVNFSSANRPVVSAPAGFANPNLAAGYVIATSTTVNYNLNPYSVWLRLQPWGDNYSNGCDVSDLQFFSYGACITTGALLQSQINRCYLLSTSHALDLCQFSYRTRVTDCFINTQGSHGNYWNWGIGIDGGSQFVEISNCTFATTTGWSIMSQEGGLYLNNYIVPSAYGAFIFPDPAPAQIATLIDNYIYDDQTYITDCAMFIGALTQLNIMGGAIAIENSPNIPLFRMSGCQATNIESILELNVGASSPNQGVFHFESPVLNGVRTGPIRLSGQKYYALNQGINAIGTFSVTNGSNIIIASTPQTLIAGTPIIFSSQPLSKYILATSVTSGTSLTLTQLYAGTTNSAALGFLNFYEPWMPEDGYGIQGLVYITPQELESHTINWVTDSDYMMLVNDFLWKKLYIQDTNNIMTTSHNLILPAINGYERIVYNYTGQTINVGANTYSTISIGVGDSAQLICTPVNLKGTVSLSQLNTNVVGIGTNFTSTLVVNQPVYFNSDPDKFYLVASITDDTHLTLMTAYEEVTISSVNILTPTWTSVSEQDQIIKITSGTSSTAKHGNITNLINVANAYTLTTDLNPFAGQKLFVKDQSGHADTYNITITANSGQTIDGATYTIINTARGSVTLIYDGISDWTIV